MGSLFSRRGLLGLLSGFFASWFLPRIAAAKPEHKAPAAKGIPHGMKAFAVFVNGRPIGTIGVGDHGLLSAAIHWSSGRSVESDGQFFMMLGGLVRSAGGQRENLGWPAPSLHLGDEVTIRFVEVEQVDPPNLRELIEQAGPPLGAKPIG
jgi:hypothetical protein